MELSPQRLIDLAVRLIAYPGVVAARDRQERAETPAAAGDGVRYVEPTAVGIASDPIFNSVFDTGEVVG